MNRTHRSGKKNLTVIEHPIVQAGMTILRNKRTKMPEFREVLHQISRIIAYEAMRGIRTTSRSVMTPLGRAKGSALAQEVIYVPVLRAGLGLLSGSLEVYPNARVGHIGLYRDEETLEPIEYYSNFPKRMSSGFVIVLDPMLATGGSSSAALQLLRKKGVKRPMLATLISAPEGISRIRKDHPETHIVTCAIDKRLDKRGFIVPGLGDAGDRLFGT